MNAVTIEIQLDPEAINAFIASEDAVDPVDESNYEEIHGIMCEIASKLEKFGYVRCQMYINQEVYHSKQ
jgi:hypothetical protein